MSSEQDTAGRRRGGNAAGLKVSRGQGTPRPPSVKGQFNLPPVLAWKLRVAAANEGVRPCVLVARALALILKDCKFPPVPDAVKAQCRGGGMDEAAA